MKINFFSFFFVDFGLGKWRFYYYCEYMLVVVAWPHDECDYIFIARCCVQRQLMSCLLSIISSRFVYRFFRFFFCGPHLRKVLRLCWAHRFWLLFAVVGQRPLTISLWSHSYTNTHDVSSAERHIENGNSLKAFRRRAASAIVMTSIGRLMSASSRQTINLIRIVAHDGNSHTYPCSMRVVNEI